MSRETYEKTTVDNHGILWLNKEHKKEELDPKNLREIAIIYSSNYRKHRYELVEEPKKQCNRIFIAEKLAINVIMDCRIKTAQKCKTILGFK